MNSTQGTEMEHYDNNYRIDSGIGPVTDNFLGSIIDRITTEKFRENLTNKIVDPILGTVNKKIQPYIHIGIAMYIVLLVLLLIIIYLLIKKKSLM